MSMRPTLVVPDTGSEGIRTSSRVLTMGEHRFAFSGDEIIAYWNVRSKLHMRRGHTTETMRRHLHETNTFKFPIVDLDLFYKTLDGIELS